MYVAVVCSNLDPL